MKKLLPLLAVVILAGCNAEAGGRPGVRDPEPFEAPIIRTYWDLERFPTICERRDENLRILVRTQEAHNFDSDPDKLNEEDRAFNSRLKATIWWYRYKCQ